MQKTFKELEQELVDSKKHEKNLKERVGTLRTELTKTKHHMKGLIGQYERVIKDWKRIASEYEQHVFKIFFITVYRKIKMKGGGK